MKRIAMLRCLLLLSAILQVGCSDDPVAQRPKQQSFACLSQSNERAIAPPLQSKEIVAGVLPVSFAVTDSGEAVLSLPISVPPGAAGLEPSLTMTYSSASGDGLLGPGFGISAASAITRCPKTMAIDGEIRGVQYDADDAFCLENQRLVLISADGDERHYRTLPDTQTKIVEHLAKSYFEVFLPSGQVILYGNTPETTPMVRADMPRAWLASEKRDAHDNETYSYCFAENDEGVVVEYALKEIDYGSRAVSFLYGVKEPHEVRDGFAAGVPFQQSLRLHEVQTSVDDELVRRYELGYAPSETTNRSRLTSVQECGADGACTPETKFMYSSTTTGFEKVSTSIAAPLSKRASYLLGDFSGDGLDDLLVPDTTAASTPANPITEWRLAKNQGNGFAPAKLAFSQQWSFQANPQQPSDPTSLQPELGIAFDYNQDGRMDVLLHDLYGSKNNFIVLISQADGTLAELDTGLTRPFPLGLAPTQLRSAGGSVHLADVTGDGVGDLIVCEDHGDPGAGNPGQSAWTAHAWRPEGFEKAGEYIKPLAGIACDAEMYPVDTNHDGITDLLTPGVQKNNGQTGAKTGTYSVHRRNSDGTWEVFDWALPLASSSRLLFADVNNDGLPDVITGDAAGRLLTWKNTGRGFVEKPENSLDWDGLSPQTKYLYLATQLDWDGDGKQDLLMPLVDALSPDVPRWVILRAINGRSGFTFERIDAGIPFEAQLGEAVTLADPRGPRIGDVNGDGAADVFLLIGNELQIFVNQSANADLVTSFSDGLNEHEPDEPQFVPNVSIAYGHLIDDGELYNAHADKANACEYPRKCVVGARRVVSAYETNDSQGGARKFGVQYRDGRADHRGFGFLGFGEKIVTDLDTHAAFATFYDNETTVTLGNRSAYPFVKQVQSIWSWAPALPHEAKQERVEMAFVDSTREIVPTNDGKTYFTLKTKEHSRQMQGSFAGAGSLEAWVRDVAVNENATMLRDTTTEVLDYDVFGNVLDVDVSTIGVDLTYRIKRTVKNDVVRWILGQMQTFEECSTAAGISQCRLTTRTTNAFGEVETESRSSDDNLPDTQLTITIDQRDAHGNIEHVKAEDAFGHIREMTTVYDNDGVFPVSSTNSLGHETRFEYDASFGVLRKATDANGLVTEWEHDSLGRETLEKRPDGSETSTTLSRTNINGVWRLAQRTTTMGGADDEVLWDSLGRPIETFSFGPTVEGNAQRIKQVIEYDRLSGNIARKSVPTAETTPLAQLEFDEYDYDALGREIRHVTPWNAITTRKYNGLTIDSMDALNHLTTTQLDALGRPRVITDAANGKTTYTYGPFKHLRSVTDPGGAKTTWALDALGRARSINDPDRGLTTFVNDGFGDMLASTDALGRVTTFGVDALGRVNTRVDKLGAQVLTTTWVWDTAPNGKGKLHSLTSPDAMQTFSYTPKGQLEGMVQTVNGDSLAMRRHFDNAGRVKAIDYPQPLGADPFGVTYDHDDHGFVVGVREKNTQESLWTLNEVDEAGRFATETFGNGVTTTRDYDDVKQALKSTSTNLGLTKIQALDYEWDAQLNLKSRSDALQVQNKTERFRYDDLERVTCAYFSAVENALAPCAQSFAYAPNGNLSNKSGIGAYAYLDPAHPHAVTNVAGESYAYNAVGNQITRPGNTTITYTPFDLPKTITQNGKTTSFGYDGAQKRIRKTSATSETVYFEDIFEQVSNGAAKELRYSVFSPERVIAVVTRGGNEPGTKYLHVDHLGSVESVTNEKGAVVDKRSFDVYGARRNPQWGMPGGVTTSKTTKGYTGHEEEDEFGLVNMRGRWFDPRLGRFTTTDPVIADLGHGQTLNRYSYVIGNPLAFVDPTGFSPEPAPIMPVGSSVQTLPNGMIDVHIWYSEPKAPEEDLLEGLESTNSLRFTSDVDTTGDGGSDLPQETVESEGRSIGQLVGGYLFGVGEGLVPFAALGHGIADEYGFSQNKSEEARIGLAIGQIVGGVFSLIGGIGGEVLGGAATVTGVGAAIGVPAMVVSAVAITGGVANIAAGFAGLASVMKEGGGGGTKTPVPVRDYASSRTVNRSAKYASEREARAIARTHIGKDPVKVGPGKLRSQDGRWQYRGKPDDLHGHSPTDSAHIHLEKLDPKTGEVLENWHLRW